MTTSLLIADRDKGECTGIEWFLIHSSLSFDSIHLSHHESDTLALIERIQPTVLLIELPMFSDMAVKKLVEITENSNIQIICTSTEATFEQARQVIQLGGIDLLLKPYTPTRLYAVIKKALRKYEKSLLLHSKSAIDSKNTSDRPITYELLFDQNTSETFSGTIALFLPENKGNLSVLHQELNAYFHSSNSTRLLFSNMVGVFFHTTQSTNEEIQQFKNHWETLNLGGLSIILSSYESENLHRMFEASRSMTEMIFYQGKNKILDFQKPIVWKKIDPFLTFSEQRKWIDMLNQQSLDAIKDFFYDGFLHPHTPYPYPHFVRTKLTSILAQVRRYMQLYHIDIEAEYEKMYNVILEEPVLYVIVQDFIIFIQQVFEVAKKREQQSHFDAVEQAIHYLERNYWDPKLSLDRVADEVNRNASYLSHLIKARTGLSFRQHLLVIRLREGQRLLKETSLPIQEISSLCGFDEANYFSRCFHKKFGLPPRSYRMLKGERRESN